MKIYRGPVYNEYVIESWLFNVTWCTQKNCNGTYSKDIALPFIRYIRDYRGAQLQVFGKILFTTHTRTL